MGPLGMWFQPIPDVGNNGALGESSEASKSDSDVYEEQQGPAVADRKPDAAAARGADREQIYHPWLTTWAGPKSTAAGVIACVSAGLVTAFIFNTGYVLSTAEGMSEGWVRDSFIATASPIHEVATDVRLTLVSDGIQTALGRSAISDDEFDTSDVQAVVDKSRGPIGGGPSGASVSAPLIPVTTPADEPGGPTSTPDSISDTTAREPALLPELIAPFAKNAPIRPLPIMAANLPQPTTSDRLKILVTGDSLSTFPGFLLQERFSEVDLVRAKLIWHNGTGLTKPRLLDWRVYLADQVEKRGTDVVVMMLGANDMGTLTKQGKVIPVHTDEWRGEYALRVVAVTNAAIKAGAQSVIWVGPPSARSKQVDKYYRDINAALGAASEVIEGLYVVDLSTGTQYVEASRRNGQIVALRQPDGIHWTRQGSIEPANAILSVLETGYPSLAPRLQAVRAESVD
jgi:hypothetical protein